MHFSQVGLIMPSLTGRISGQLRRSSNQQQNTTKRATNEHKIREQAKLQLRETETTSGHRAFMKGAWQYSVMDQIIFRFCLWKFNMYIAYLTCTCSIIVKNVNIYKIISGVHDVLRGGETCLWINVLNRCFTLSLMMQCYTSFVLHGENAIGLKW